MTHHGYGVGDACGRCFLQRDVAVFFGWVLFALGGEHIEGNV